MSAGPFRRVLAGWDCSAGSAAALRAAAAIADGETGRVVALAVLRLVPRGESEEDRGAEVASLRHQARRVVRESQGHAAGCLESQGQPGAPAESSDAARALYEYADSHLFELLVLGLHGTGGIMRPRLGHVAETLAKKNDQPLLLLEGQS